jgi:hypothetical protein
MIVKISVHPTLSVLLKISADIEWILEVIAAKREDLIRGVCVP